MGMDLMKKTVSAYRRKDGVVDRLSVTDLCYEARERRDRFSAVSNIYNTIVQKTLGNVNPFR